MNNIKEYIYIYNENQAFFYIENKLRPLEIGVNPNTNKRWYKFKRELTKPLFDKWCKREN